MSKTQKKTAWIAVQNDLFFKNHIVFISSFASENKNDHTA